MRKIREVLRLRLAQGLSQLAIGQSLRLSVGAVNAYLSRARMAGLGWPLPTELDDEQLEGLLYPPPPDVATERRPLPDWTMGHRELRRPNVIDGATGEVRRAKAFVAVLGASQLHLRGAVWSESLPDSCNVTASKRRKLRRLVSFDQKPQRWAMRFTAAGVSASRARD